MDSILLAAETFSDLDMDNIASYFAEVASIPEDERLSAGTPREFKPPSHNIDEIRLVLVTEADDPSHGDLDTSRGENRVTKDMIKIDEHKLRDLKEYPPEVRRRLIGTGIKEIAQLCELGSFAFYKSETKVDTVASKLMGSSSTRSSTTRTENSLRTRPASSSRALRSASASTSFLRSRPWPL